MLYLQLQIEQQTRAELLNSGRTDAIARLLLRRIEKEIVKIEGQIHEKEKRDNQNTECRNTGGFMAIVFKGLHRFRSHKKRRDNPLFQVSQGAKQQISEVAR